VEFRHFTLLKVGFLASLPLWAGVIGDTVGGLATDWLLKKSGNTRFARRAVAIVGMLGCVVFHRASRTNRGCLHCRVLSDGGHVFSGMHHRAFLGCPMDVGSKNSGTVSGMMNIAGNIGGALSPIVFGILVQFGNWQAPFIVTAGLLVVGAAVWAFWVDPEASVVEEKYKLPTAASVAAD
jgi:MFS family permease